MVAKLMVLFIIVIAGFTMMGWLSLDTFTNLWQQAFVMAIKSALFAMIPGGFLFAVYLMLMGE
jgi:hypothetical protein